MGIEKIPLIIPEQWSPTWFRTFVMEVLAPLDTRNSLGVGLVVSSDGNSVATLDVTAALNAAINAAIDVHELATDPHPDIIDELATAAAITDSDEFIVSQGGTNQAATALQLRTYMQAESWIGAATVTAVAGGTVTGTVGGTTSMLDGQEYQIVEAAGTPGFDLQFTFTGIVRTPSEIVARLWYDGSSTHGVAFELWNYSGTPAFDRVHQFSTMLDYQVVVIPLPDWTNYVSAGEAKVRIVHFTAGNPAHDVHVEFLALRCFE